MKTDMEGEEGHSPSSLLSSLFEIFALLLFLCPTPDESDD